MQMKKILVYSFIIFTTLDLWSRELVVWTSNEAAAKGIRAQKADFEKKYKATVVVEVLNKDLTSLFKTAALTGKGPDILLWAHDVSGELAQSGLIEPLDENQSLLNVFVPVSTKAFKYKGRLYGYPYAVEATALFYNTDLVKTPPKTFEELETMALKFNAPKKNKYGFLFDFKNFFFSFPFFNASGAYLFKETENGLDPAKTGLGEPGFVQGLAYLKHLSTTGLIPTSTDRGIAFEHFKKNQLMFMIDGPWAIKDLNESQIHYQIAPLPTLKNQTARPFVGVQGFMIRRSSQQKLLAKEFIETYLISKTAVQEIYKFDPRLPARIDVLAELAEKNQQVMTLKQSVESGIAMPNIPQMSLIWSAMGKAMSLCFEQNYSPTDAMKLVTAQKQ
jgi:maltose/maltodextrin transport system substrate-binding protein